MRKDLMGISANPLYYSLVGAVFKLSGFAFVHSPVPSTVRVWLPSPHLSRQTLLYLIFFVHFWMLWVWLIVVCILVISVHWFVLHLSRQAFSLVQLLLIVLFVYPCMVCAFFCIHFPHLCCSFFCFVLHFVSISPPVKAGCLTGAGVGVLTTPGCSGSSSVSCVLPTKTFPE